MRISASAVARAALLASLLAGCDGDRASPSYTVGGTVTGLGAGLTVVLHNHGRDLVVTANGDFAFPRPEPDGALYLVSVTAHPLGQTCVLTAARGNVPGGNVTTVAVACADNPFAIGGTVTGLAPGATLVLRNRGLDDLSLAADGTFAFPARLADGDGYGVSVARSPALQACSVARDRGIAHAAVSDVAVTCRTLLDPAFGGRGTGFLGHPGIPGGAGNTQANALARDASGRLLVVGSSADAQGIGRLALWRLRADGTPDPDFNGTGLVTHAGVGETVGLGVAVDGQGRILVSGFSTGSDRQLGLALWRFTDAGALDASFAGTGFVRLSGSPSGATRCAADASRRPVVSGFVWNGSAWDAALWRFTEDGAADAAFGSGGRVLSHAAAGGPGDSVAAALLLDGRGRILTAGYGTTSLGDPDLLVWRTLEDGTPDAAFHATGVVALGGASGGSGSDVGSDLALDASGRILVAGLVRADLLADADLAVWRLLDDGTPDAAFGGRGWVVRAGGAGSDDAGRALALDAGGRIVVAGVAGTSAGDGDLAVWRFLDDGTPDATFGDGGQATFAGSAGGIGLADGGSALVLDDGVVVGGYSQAGTEASPTTLMGLWRLGP